jgi:ureidoglycolate lyase
MKLKAKTLDAAVFAPFGSVLARPTVAPTAELGEGELRYWADVVRLPDLGGAAGLGYATLAMRPLVQTCAEQHVHSPEVLQPIGGDMIVVVGPATPAGQLPPLDRFAAFRVPQDQAVVLKPGVWHYAPFAIDRPMAFTVLLKAGTNRDDAIFAEFPAGGVLEIEVE